MKTLRDWTLNACTPTGVELLVEGRHLLRVSVLDEQLFRVSLLKNRSWRLDRTWTVAPDGHTPWEGRDRDNLDGFACPTFRLDEGDPLRLQTGMLRLEIQRPLKFVWAARIDDAWQVFAQDRPTGAYLLGREDHAVSHHMRRTAGEAVYGLGEKAGALNRDGGRYEMRNLDALGYDARRTDPLYKHVPFALIRTAAAGCWSIFYDNLASCWFDLGNEIDNYHAPFRSYRAEDGDLDYYLRWEPDLLALTRAQVRLTGGTLFPPRWSLGYSGSTMSYTDAPDAQAQLLGFLEQIREHDIPCDSFHLSSGYTSIGDRRYVFNWNREKVPDPAGLAVEFAAQGVRIVANIKPCLLNDHPRYAEAAAAGLFIRDSDSGEPERSAFWDDWGSHLDFTNSETVEWWKRGVTTQLLDYGISATWNDNNEYEIWDRRARCAGFGQPIDIALIRPLHSLFMCRASEEAQREHAPGKRPYLVCRSGGPGLQRHAQTWTGDNRSAWDTLRWNLRMGLGLSLSGFYNVGHDVGGFAGPRPEPELFLRWVQNGIFHPRFSIHSWNDDGSVNEPWMYPEMTELVRRAIELRYRLLPYLYTCLWLAASEHEPMLRPTFLDHPRDSRCQDDSDDFLLGRNLLIAGVVEPAQETRAVYLPDNGVGWWDFFAGVWHAGGQTVSVPVTLESIPLFVRAGTVLPLGRGADRATVDGETGRDLMVFPLSGDGEEHSCLYEDDGESENPPYSLLCFTLKCREGVQTLDWIQRGDASPTFTEARLIVADGVTPISVRGRSATDGDAIALA
jgi:alpha-glucosidase